MGSTSREALIPGLDVGRARWSSQIRVRVAVDKTTSSCLIAWIIWDFAAHCSTLAVSCERRQNTGGKPTHGAINEGSHGHHQRCILSFGIDSGVMETLRSVAPREHCAVANMVEMLIRDYCGRSGIAIPEPRADKMP
jgi:hypothetical protein